ncbi:MAG: histidine kinase dimerization/phospho-acceptor domain-containing protein, partial [Nitrospirota bacterium]
MKLWVKIAMLNVFVVVGLGVMISIAVRTVVTNSMREELTKQGKSVARNLSERIADAILLNNLYTVQEAIENVQKTEHDIEYIFVTGKQGFVSAHTFSNGHPPDLLAWNPLDHNNTSSIQLLSTEQGLIRDIGLRVFEGMDHELHIGLKEDRLKQTLDSIRNITVAITIMAILIGSALSCSLSRLVTRPLSLLADFTHSLSKGDFGKTVCIRTRDEVGELSQTFNNLSLELEKYRRKMEESYKQMLTTEKLTALGRLSAGLAHEIRNPLTSIKILFQTFKDNPALTKEDMKVVLSAVEQMDDLLSKFLRFAKSDEFNISDVYINSLIKQVLNLTQFQTKNQSIKVNLELSKLPPVKADRAMLQQALMNLVLNGIEAMPGGGTLVISDKTENGNIFVSV